jgi:branched-chain amino acid transport system substrate-binding protein
MQHHDAWIDPVTHQCQQTIYMATYNDKPADKDDIFKVMSQVPPSEIQDPDAAKSCKMASYQETPSYEQ